jgi:hypothetical protein
VRHAETLLIDEIAAELSRGDRDRVAAPRTRAAADIDTVRSTDVRHRGQRRGDDVQP